MHEWLVRTAIDILCVGVIGIGAMIGLSIVISIVIKICDVWSEYEWEQKQKRCREKNKD